MKEENRKALEKRISGAFEKARVPDATYREVELELISDADLDAEIRKIPNLKTCGHASPAKVGRHRGAAAHRIKVPKKSAQELIAAAVVQLKKK